MDEEESEDEIELEELETVEDGSEGGSEGVLEVEDGCLGIEEVEVGGRKGDVDVFGEEVGET